MEKLTKEDGTSVNSETSFKSDFIGKPLSGIKYLKQSSTYKRVFVNTDALKKQCYIEIWFVHDLKTLRLSRSRDCIVDVPKPAVRPDISETPIRTVDNAVDATTV